MSLDPEIFEKIAAKHTDEAEFRQAVVDQMGTVVKVLSDLQQHVTDMEKRLGGLTRLVGEMRKAPPPPK